MTEQDAIFVLNDICLLEIFDYLTLKEILHVAEADPRFRRAAKLKYAKIQPYVLADTIKLCSREVLQDFYEESGRVAPAVVFENLSESDLALALPYFKNIKEFVLTTGKYPLSASLLPMLPRALKTLQLHRCTIPNAVLRPWLLDLNKSLRWLFFIDLTERDFEPRDESQEAKDEANNARLAKGVDLTTFIELTNIEELIVNKLEIRNYLPMNSVKHLHMTQATHYCFLSPTDLFTLASTLEKLTLEGVWFPEFARNYPMDSPLPVMDTKLYQLAVLQSNMLEMRFFPPLTSLTNLSILKSSFVRKCTLAPLSELKKLKRLSLANCHNLKSSWKELLTLLKALYELETCSLSMEGLDDVDMPQGFYREINKYLLHSQRIVSMRTWSTNIVPTERFKHSDFSQFGGREL